MMMMNMRNGNMIPANVFLACPQALGKWSDVGEGELIPNRHL